MGCNSSKNVPSGRMLDYQGQSFRSNLVQHKIRDVNLEYDVDPEPLGHAAMGCSVQRVNLKKDHSAYAMKTFSLRTKFESKSEQKKMLEYLRNEIQLLRDLDHPHIVRPVETYEWNDSLHLIMELCGKDLTSRTYTEDQARDIMRQILGVISYCHDKQVCHRDLKLENILFETNNPECMSVKLIDFGMSRRFKSGDAMTERVGTVYTMAPEVILGHYTNKCDMWSIGVITYQLLTGVAPFDGNDDQQTISMSAAVNFNWPTDIAISNLAKDFVNHLIVFDPKRRWSAARALSADWMTEGQRPPSRVQRSRSFKELLVNTMQNYASYSTLKKSALMFLAYNTHPDKLRELKDVFTALDTRQDGVLTKSEFREGLRQAGLTFAQIDAMFTSLDFDRSGQLQYLEFIAATIEMLGNLGDDWLVESFDLLDTDHTGFVTPQNLHRVLGDSFTEAEILQMVAEADLDNNGQIDFEEYRAFMHRNAAVVPTVVTKVISESDVVGMPLEEVDLTPVEP